jgi:hypothetical protein
MDAEAGGVGADDRLDADGRGARADAAHLCSSARSTHRGFGKAPMTVDGGKPWPAEIIVVESAFDLAADEFRIVRLAAHPSETPSA